MALSNRAVVFLVEKTQLERKGVSALWCALIQIRRLCTSHGQGACYKFLLGFLKLYLHHPHHHFPTSKHKNVSHSRLILDWSVTRKMRQEIECPNQSRLLLGSDNAETLLQERKFIVHTLQVLWSQYRKGRAVRSMKIYLYSMHLGLPTFNQLINYMWCKML